MNSAHVASVALTCLMMPPMLRALTVGVAAACASVRPCAVWRRKRRWAFNVSRRPVRSAVVVGIGSPCAMRADGAGEASRRVLQLVGGRWWWCGRYTLGAVYLIGLLIAW